jgi:hypothetical protein
VQKGKEIFTTKTLLSLSEILPHPKPASIKKTTLVRQTKVIFGLRKRNQTEQNRGKSKQRQR